MRMSIWALVVLICAVCGGTAAAAPPPDAAVAALEADQRRLAEIREQVIDEVASDPAVLAAWREHRARGGQMELRVFALSSLVPREPYDWDPVERPWTNTRIERRGDGRCYMVADGAESMEAPCPADTAEAPR